MRTRKSDTTTSESLKSSMTSSALSCSHHMAEMAEKPGDISVNLALKLSEKKQMDYSILIHWLRAKLSFSLSRSAVLCVGSSRTTKHELNTDFSGAEIANVIGKIKWTRVTFKQRVECLILKDSVHLV